MLCAISGEAPQVPVASSKSGVVYERRLIEAYITENGTEPTTGEALTVEDLIDLKTSRVVRPRPPSLTSIPSLLGVFQEEWDALALEAYTLRQNLVQTRQELSTALYQHDAAVRVIARLTKERDEAREALSNISVNPQASATNGDSMQVDITPLSADAIKKIDETQEKLSKTRRKRPVPEDWATADDVASYTTTNSVEPQWETTFDIVQDMALVGNSDGNAGVYSISRDSTVARLGVGGGAITGGLFAKSKAIFATSAGRVKIFEGPQELASFEAHSGEVSGLSVHPSGSILASVGKDKSYVLYDLADNTVLTQVYSDSALTCVKFHPDGHILAAGATDGEIKIFDVKSGTQAATYNLGEPLKALFFSENGTWLAAVVRDSAAVSIWDLRKSAEIKKLEIGSRIDTISWDYTGQFLLAGGPEGVSVEHYSKTSKEWSELLKSAVPATLVAWGNLARSIFAVGSNGSITTIAESS